MEDVRAIYGSSSSLFPLLARRWVQQADFLPKNDDLHSNVYITVVLAIAAQVIIACSDTSPNCLHHCSYAITYYSTGHHCSDNGLHLL